MRFLISLLLLTASCTSDRPSTPFELASSAKSSEGDVAASIEALGDTPEERRLLLEKIGDSSWLVRRSAASRLAAIATPEAALALEKAARDADSRVRRRALESLSVSADPARLEVLDRLSEVEDWGPLEKTAIDAAKVRVSPRAEARASALARILDTARNSKSRLVRVDAVFRATEVAPGQKEVLALLRNLIEDALNRRGEPRLTGRAIDHLIQFKDEWPKKNYLRLCLSSDPKLRDAAMIVAGIQAEDRIATGRRLVDESWRKRYCKQMRPAE